MSPGPGAGHAATASPVLIRRVNALPPPEQNGGFGVPEVSTHLHNFHSGARQRRRAVRPRSSSGSSSAASTTTTSTTCSSPDGARRNPPAATSGRRSASSGTTTTASITRRRTRTRGWSGPAIIFNEFDTGNERHGLPPAELPELRHPARVRGQAHRPDDRACSRSTRSTSDGLLGNVFLVNGKVQPFHPVQKRRYRFRLLDAGPSRFYEFFLDEPREPEPEDPLLGHLERRQPAAAADQGHELPRRRGGAHRHHHRLQRRSPSAFGNPPVIRLENRLEQVNGRGPTGKILPGRPGRPAARVPARRQPRRPTPASTRSRCRSRTCRRRRTTPCSRRSRCRTSAR